MQLGLLPAMGGSIAELWKSGQDARLVDSYMRAYAGSFERIWYFSYAPESLDRYTGDARLLASVRVLGPRRPMPRALRALTIPLAHGHVIVDCAVLRVFQITGVIPALIARVRHGVPFVTTFGFWYDTLSQPGPKRCLKTVVQRLGLRHAAAVIATTKPLAAEAARFARRVVVIPNGIDTQRFVPATGRPEHRVDREQRVLYVGRLSPEKNLSTLIRAAAMLKPRVAVKLVIVGSGPLRERLAAEADAAAVPVDFRGIVDQRRLPALYRDADAFVLASFTEGHPKVLLEAMSSGLPCVVSDCDGNRSLVTSSETGLLFDPGRPDELATCLKRVFTDHALAVSLGRAGRRLVVDHYDLAGRLDEEVMLLADVARSGASAR